MKLQGGDEQSLTIWHQFIEESLRHCEAVYDKLGIQIKRSDLRAESFYNNKLKDIVDNLHKKGLLTVSDGARCVFLPDFKGKDDEPLPVIIQKSDGGFLYATTDLALFSFGLRSLLLIEYFTSLMRARASIFSRYLPLLRPPDLLVRPASLSTWRTGP